MSSSQPRPSSVDPTTALQILERGVDDIISREELGAKLFTATAAGRPLRIKLGIDPTSPDIHLGFSVVLKKLRAFQDLGHEAHLIVGDFTASIGDPSGRSLTRPQLSRAQIEANALTYQEQLFRILDRERTRLHFNSDWLGKLTFSDVIEIAGRHTVAQILEREDFATRLERRQPLGLHEILYPLAQGQDSVVIRADVELGGSDQRFNNLMGRELQRAVGQEPQVVMLMPLLVGTDGQNKMSKSLGNYIGIYEPPGEIYGKVMSLPDDLMPSYFELCTSVPLQRVQELLAGHPMEAKKALAQDIVQQYWGPSAAEEAAAGFTRLFSAREIPEEMPEVRLPATPVTVVDLLRQCFEMSGSEARRLVTQGGVQVEGQRVGDPNSQLVPRTGMVVRAGKRRFARLLVS